MAQRVFSAEEAYDFLTQSDDETTLTASDDDVTLTASDIDPVSDGSTSESEEEDDGLGPSAKVGRGEPDSKYNWVPPNMIDPVIPAFTGTPGIRCGIDASEPNSFFNLMFAPEFFELLAAQTNIYAAQCQAADQGDRSQTWYPTDPHEIKKFWALTLMMGIVKKPTMRLYWSTDPIISTPAFSQIMPRNRYFELLKCLHFSDNSQCPPREHPQFDRLYKLRPIINYFSSKFPEIYTPDQNVAIDESLVLFKGRLNFKQYIPSKRSRYGVKLYKLCESGTGYTVSFRIYEGKDSYLDPPGCPQSVGTSGKIVWDLLSPYLNKGYHLWVDNFYTSPDLFHFLFLQQTPACGTVRPTCKGFPKILMYPKQKRGSTSALRSQELLALRYTDRKDVYILSTIHNEKVVPVSVRGEGDTQGLKPQCITDYNKNMGGVDLSDQCLQPYLVLRKTKTWYKKVAIYLTQVAMYNTYVLYKKCATGKIYNFLELQLKILRDILFEQANPNVQDENVLRLTGRHFPSTIPTTGAKQKPQKRCRVCYKKGIRKDSRYHCPSCPSLPGLCINECFMIYHTKVDY
ncbi:piggyBac transposable element-derived protein 4-like [Spea bombifrons]|uniref:piggyBac transposable element-derived protein 4-like n=1 Tax=Spea bombifrons TaxID=233779 RepID=UPI00234AB8DD|nr:piggyBac transposable element-derived protein 4-like [Spea bombifrons]